MIYRLHIALLMLMMCFTTVPALSAEITQELQKQAKDPGRELKVKSKKSLLSALLLLNVVSSKSNMASSGNTLSLPKIDHTLDEYPLEFLKGPAMKKNAVEVLYKKYGFNNAVQGNLHLFSTHKYSFQERLVRSGRYIGTMSDIFSEEGLPRELVFLPLIESEFNPYAYSRSRAAGPWQFMPATANTLDLKMDWWVDERRDPVKSTWAAASYLKYLHGRFRSWNLALAAYNAGEARIGMALKHIDRKDFWTLRKTRLLTQETRNYVPSYIAATAIAMDPETFGFSQLEYHKPFEYDEVTIDSPMDLTVIARFTGVRTEDIKDLNPELRRLCTPPNVSSYTVRIPRGTKKQFMKNLEKTKGHESYYINLYTVKSGDTVEKIAKHLGATIAAIIEMNGLGARAVIIAGRKILIPLKTNWEKILQTDRLKK